eukprot:gene18160-21718_t
MSDQQGGRIRAIPSRPRRLFRDSKGQRYIRKRGNRIYIKSKKDDKQLIRAMIASQRPTAKQLRLPVAIDYGAIRSIQDNHFRELMLKQRDKPNDITRGIENKKRVADLELSKLAAEMKLVESDDQMQALERQIRDLETKKRHAEENAIAYQDLIKHDEEQYNLKIDKIKQDSDEKAKRLEEELKKVEEDTKELETIIAKHKIHTKVGLAPRGADRTIKESHQTRRSEEHDAPLINLFRPYTAAMNGAKKGEELREVGKEYDEFERVGYNDLDAKNAALTGVFETMKVVLAAAAERNKRPFVDRQVNLGDRSPSRDQSGDGNVCTCGGNQEGEGMSQARDLGQGGLYNTEIEHIMQPYHKDGFVGVISSDGVMSIPVKNSRGEQHDALSFIMNLDPSNKPGTLGENRLFSSCTTSRQ